MNRIVSIVFLVILFSNISNGQWALGPMLGVNISSTVAKLNSETIRSNSVINFQLSGIVEYKMTKKWNLSAGIGYSPKGSKSKNLLASISSIQDRYTYAEILPSLQFSVINNLRLGLGPSLSLSIKEEVKYNNDSWFNTNEFDIIKPLDLGIFCSIDYKINSLIFKFRANKGLTNFSNANFVDREGNPIEGQLLNFNVQFSVGYLFEFGEDIENKLNCTY